MSKLKVQNRGGTSTRSPKCSVCGPWIEHWYSLKGISFVDRLSGDTCCARCGGEAEVGGHVIKSDSQDKKEYIIPLCNGCNVKDCGVPYEVEAEFLVPAVHPDNK